MILECLHTSLTYSLVENGVRQQCPEASWPMDWQIAVQMLNNYFLRALVRTHTCTIQAAEPLALECLETDLQAHQEESPCPPQRAPFQVRVCSSDAEYLSINTSVTHHHYNDPSLSLRARRCRDSLDLSTAKSHCDVCPLLWRSEMAWRDWWWRTVFTNHSSFQSSVQESRGSTPAGQRTGGLECEGSGE